MSNSILIIEDEPDVLKLLNRILAPHGYEIVEALGGAAALATLHETSPAIILLDLAMPGINGLELLDAIQEMPHLANSKILVLTARNQMANDARKYNVEAIFIKPIRPVQLLNVIKDLL